MLATGRSCLIWSFKDLRTAFLRTGAIRGFGFTWRIILRVGLGVGLAVGVKVDLGAGRGVYLGLAGVRLPVITSAPFSTVKSMQVLVQSAAIEKIFDWKENNNEEIIKILKTLKESSKRSARYSQFAQSLMLRCWRPLESLTQLHFLDLIAMH